MELEDTELNPIIEKDAICYLINNEKNVVQPLNEEIIEKDTLVKGKGKFVYSVNLPEPSKLLVFVVANHNKPKAVAWAIKIIEYCLRSSLAL